MLTLILARARNGAIGLGNGLPWRLPEDLAHFKRATMGATLLMGRRTWESIGRPLPGRTLVVLSRRPPAPAAAGSAEPSSSASSSSSSSAVRHESDLDAAIASHGAEGRELFVIGGADLYRQVLPKADRVLLTEIDSEPAADTFFEADFSEGWDTVSRDERIAADGTRFTWLDLRRRVI